MTLMLPPLLVQAAQLIFFLTALLLAQAAAATAVPVQFSLVVDAMLVFVVVGAIWRGGAASNRMEQSHSQMTGAMAELKLGLKELQQDTAAKNLSLVRIQGTLEVLERGQREMQGTLGGQLLLTSELKERMTKNEVKCENLGLMVAELRHDMETTFTRLDREQGSLREFRHDVENAASGIELAEALRRRKQRPQPDEGGAGA